MSRRVPMVAVSCLAVVLGGCSLTGANSSTGSSGSFTGTQGLIASTLNLFASDSSSDNPTDLCNKVFDAALKQKVAAAGKAANAGGCAAVIKNQLKTIGDFTLTVESIKVNGQTATAVVQTSRPARRSTRRCASPTSASAGWRLDSLL